MRWVYNVSEVIVIVTWYNVNVHEMKINWQTSRKKIVIRIMMDVQPRHAERNDEGRYYFSNYSIN